MCLMTCCQKAVSCWFVLFGKAVFVGCLIFLWQNLCLFPVIAQEATHKGIEAFSKDNLKHIKTQEKNPLPTAAGNAKFFSEDL